MLSTDNHLLAPRHFARHLTRLELQLILDVCNGSVPLDRKDSGWRIPPRTAFIASLSDAVHLDHVDKKWEVNWPTLRAKLTDLDEGQLIAVCAWAMGYWDGLGEGDL